MKLCLASAVVLALVWSTTALQARDITGTWRSSAPTPRAMVIGKTKKNYHGLFYVLICAERGCRWHTHFWTPEQGRPRSLQTLEQVRRF